VGFEDIPSTLRRELDSTPPLSLCFRSPGGYNIKPRSFLPTHEENLEVVIEAYLISMFSASDFSLHVLVKVFSVGISLHPSNSFHQQTILCSIIPSSSIVRTPPLQSSSSSTSPASITFEDLPTTSSYITANQYSPF